MTISCNAFNFLLSWYSYRKEMSQNFKILQGKKTSVTFSLFFQLSFKHYIKDKLCLRKRQQINITIHSKYFAISDWLKCHP